MLWAYGHYKYFNYFSVGIDFIPLLQNLTSKVDPLSFKVLIEIADQIDRGFDTYPGLRRFQV